jgi:alpha-N-arabinofuranosidase
VDRILIDLDRRIGPIDRNIFGGFVEHLGRCVYGGVYDPGSAHADANGLRTDVIAAARRLRYPVIRYPGGNFVSSYRWTDGVGPKDERPIRSDPAWNAIEPNTFGTNEFVGFCRAVGAEPYLVVNCGTADLQEARDWVEYCNGSRATALTKAREAHGYPEPHRIRYWGVGNEVDGPWQVGYKTPAEYARAYLEFAKVMRWADPSIKLIASAVSHWGGEVVERIQLLLEQAPDHVDYLSIHWYIGDTTGDLPAYLTASELIDDRLTAIEGLSRALTLGRRPRPPVPIAVDEWNVWYRSSANPLDPAYDGLEETYDLADALVVAMHLNAFIRHARSVGMANLAQLVNVIAPMRTNGEGLLLQSTFFPFELYSTTSGPIALDIGWTGDTFSAGDYRGVPYLDVSATLDDDRHRLAVYVVDRRLEGSSEVELALAAGRFGSEVTIHTISGDSPHAANSWEQPDRIATMTRTMQTGAGRTFTHTLEPHSVTGFEFTL